MNTKKCPECGTENPVSRATCIVCHTKLKGPAANPHEDKNPVPANQVKEKPEKVNKEAKAPAKEKVKKDSPKPKVKRRRKPKIVAPTFFSLVDGKLCSVNVLLTIKPLKVKDLVPEEKQLIKVWNRNKDLFTS